MKLVPLPPRDSAAYHELIRREPISPEVHAAVAAILADVRVRGDRAVLELTDRFDRVRLMHTHVPLGECRAALAGIDARLRGALTEMARRIEAVHQVQRFREDAVVVGPGIRVWREWRAFGRVGLYAPGGLTSYPSSVLMMAVPARLAGCREIVLCSPPQPDGHVALAVLAAAALAGVTEVHAVGGAQAVAAMAYGTQTMGRVDAIAGPGNTYVTAAKLQVFGAVAIDMPAGPSEVVVVSDGTTNPEWLKADLLAQAEHSTDALAVLVTTAASDAVAMQGISERQVRAFKAATLEEAIAFANDFAPEHLTLACRDPERWLPRVSAAGSIFLGPYAPAAAGDYATGANHVLPTGGSARSFGGLGVRSFGRAVQVQAIEREGIAGIDAVSGVLAEAEHLPAHAASIRIRSSE